MANSHNKYYYFNNTGDKIYFINDIGLDNFSLYQEGIHEGL